MEMGLIHIIRTNLKAVGFGIEIEPNCNFGTRLRFISRFHRIPNLLNYLANNVFNFIFSLTLLIIYCIICNVLYFFNYIGDNVN